MPGPPAEPENRREAQPRTPGPWSSVSSTCLVIFLEIHPVVQAGHLVAVAVEHQGGPLAEFAQPPLARLAPARMVHLADSRWSRTRTRADWPGSRGGRHAAHQADLDDRLDALEAVLPGQDHAHRRAILRRQRLAEHAQRTAAPAGAWLRPCAGLPRRGTAARGAAASACRSKKVSKATYFAFEVGSHLARAGRSANSRPTAPRSTRPPRSDAGRCALPAAPAPGSLPG